MVVHWFNPFRMEFLGKPINIFRVLPEDEVEPCNIFWAYIYSRFGVNRAWFPCGVSLLSVRALAWREDGLRQWGELNHCQGALNINEWQYF